MPSCFLAIFAFWVFAARVYGVTETPPAQALAQTSLKDRLWQEVVQRLEEIPDFPLRLPVTPKAYQASLGALPPGAGCDVLMPAVRPLLESVGPSLFVVSPRDPEFTILQNAFDPESMRQATAASRGVHLKAKGRRIFVAAVLQGSPAALGGLLPGDEVVSIQGKPPRLDPEYFPQQPLTTWVVRGHALSPVSSGSTMAGLTSLKVTAAPKQSLDDLISEHIKKSVRPIKTPTTNLIYAHLPATHRAQFLTDFKGSVQALLADEIPLRAKPPSQAHKITGLIIDLRGPFGPVGSSFAELMQEPHWFFGKDSQTPLRPVAVLIDDTTLGGREWLAWMLKAKAGAVLVGSHTGGVWTSSQWRTLKTCPGSLLIPTGPAKSPLPEGIGLTPDLVVEPALVYQSGRDPLIEAATAFLGSTTKP